VSYAVAARCLLRDEIDLHGVGVAPDVHVRAEEYPLERAVDCVATMAERAAQQVAGARVV
jgi:hypothetical protein